MATEVEERSSAWHAAWRHVASPLKSERSIRFPRHRNTYHMHVVKIKLCSEVGLPDLLRFHRFDSLVEARNTTSSRLTPAFN